MPQPCSPYGLRISNLGEACGSLCTTSSTDPSISHFYFFNYLEGKTRRI